MLFLNAQVKWKTELLKKINQSIRTSLNWGAVNFKIMNTNEYMRIWRANNKDKIKAINKKWWKENRDFLKLKRQIINESLRTNTQRSSQRDVGNC
jgi:hypothetical protein